jgi:hypothetical protein
VLAVASALYLQILHSAHASRTTATRLVTTAALPLHPSNMLICPRTEQAGFATASEEAFCLHANHD